MCVTHPVAWILIDSTISGILFTASLRSQVHVATVVHSPIVCLAIVTAGSEDLHPLRDGRLDQPTSELITLSAQIRDSLAASR